MKSVRVVLVLSVALGLQATLGMVHPEAHRYFDLMLIPVIWYGIVGSQRSGMLVGCASGLLQDSWFQIGVFGLSGFKRTLLGWVLGGLGARFDFNHLVGRVVCGAGASLADSLLDVVLRRLLDQRGAGLGAGEILIRAVVAGLLTHVAFSFADRFRHYRDDKRLA